MTILKTIMCDVCSATATEKTPGDGWSGWGELKGIILDGASNPSLCPACLKEVANFTDSLKPNPKVST